MIFTVFPLFPHEVPHDHVQFMTCLLPPLPYLIFLLYILSFRSHDGEARHIQTGLFLHIKVETIRAGRSILPIGPPLPLRCYPDEKPRQVPLIFGVQRPLLRRRNHRLGSRSFLGQDDRTSYSSLILLTSKVEDLGSPQRNWDLQPIQASLQLRHPKMSFPQFPLVDGPLRLQPPDLGTELIQGSLVKVVDRCLVQRRLPTLLKTIRVHQKGSRERPHHQIMMDDLVIQIRNRLQTLPSDHSGVVDRNRNRIRHRVPRDSIFRQTTRQQRLLEGSHLDGLDPRAPDFMSGPHLILEEQVIELLPPVLSGLSPRLHLEMLRVRLVTVVPCKLVALIVVPGPSCGRTR